MKKIPKLISLSIFIMILPNYIYSQNQDILSGKKIILGSWKVIKRMSSDGQFISRIEERECLNDVFVFKSDSIISPKDSCFYGYTCINPKYSIKKFNTKEYLNSIDVNVSYLDRINYRKKSIYVINTSCGVPFVNMELLTDNNITVSINGYVYILERIKGR